MKYFDSSILAETSWLQANLENPSVRIVEVDVDSTGYELGHISGASEWNWSTQLTDGVRRDILRKSAFEDLLGATGIANDTTVVLYGDSNNWFAAWALWQMKLYGHQDVRLLNGGRRRWLGEGRVLTQSLPSADRRSYTAKEAAPEMRSLLAEVQRALSEEGTILLDVRTEQEFRGEILAPWGLPETGQRAGHIPGALNIPWDQACDPDGKFKTKSELLDLYASMGVTPDKRIIVYCRIGERSSHTWFVLKYLLGYPDVRHYDGSWTEWGSLIAAPIETDCPVDRGRGRSRPICVTPIQLEGKTAGDCEVTDYLHRFGRIAGKTVGITTYRLGPRYYCDVDNVAPGDRLSRAEGKSVEEATARALDHAREILHGLERRLSATLANLRDAFLAVDDAWRIIFMNQRAGLLLGCRDENAVGENLWEAFPDFKEGFHDKLLDTLHRNKNADIELFYPPKKVWLNVRTSRTTEGLAIYLLDITERYLAKEVLRKSEERYRSLINDVLESSRMGICILDPQFRVVWLNHALETYLGVTKGAVIGEDMKMFISTRLNELAVEPENFAQRVLSSYEEGRFLEHCECRIRNGGFRTTRVLEYWSQPIRTGVYEGGRIEHYSDITQHKNMELQLQQVQKMEAVGRLAGGVAHDFNNLLTAILGYGDYIRDAVQDNPRLLGDVEEVIRAGQRAKVITQQLLAIGRKQIMKVGHYDPNTVVDGMLKLLERTVPENIDLSTDLGAQLGVIKVDAWKLEQALLNLVINACNAMPKGGSLIISTEKVEISESYIADAAEQIPPGEYVRLTVTDSGCGMTEEVRERAFEPFFTTNNNGKGTGLGLSSVYGFVKQSDGFVELRSKPAEGTQVHLHFPHKDADADIAPLTPSEYLPQGTETVLIVEDESAIRNLSERSLRALGYNVLTACNGQEAYEEYGDGKVELDLLLSDIVMPKMDGPTLAEHLMEEQEGLSVVYMSGFTEEDLLRRGDVDINANFLSKPFSREELAMMVRDVLDTRNVRERR